ncbi:GNAT family N-acetyltransferase [Aquibium sp. LZ166]|uniref:GNAT family N-acetyltransferase n=1 Tax=Aquibium pacificus TaxID=3153579 RepID=A0ABV3SSA4_9HYPH
MKQASDVPLIREAREEDIRSLVALFAADSIGGHGDTVDESAYPSYLAAFRRISASPCDSLYVAELGGEIVGTFQTTLTPMVTGRGRLVMTIEAVQTRADMRGRGIGATMMRAAIKIARQAGAGLVQLSSNRDREAAHRFYERLGFARSHYGFKMKLD